MCSGAADVFRAGDGGCAAFRIPALVAAGDDVLLAFAECRKWTCNDYGRHDLVMRRSTDSGGSFGELITLQLDGVPSATGTLHSLKTDDATGHVSTAITQVMTNLRYTGANGDSDSNQTKDCQRGREQCQGVLK